MVQREPCPDCGELIVAGAKVCRFCGRGRPDPNADPAVESPAIAVVWSLLWPGLGHLHRGHPVIGIAILGATALVSLLILVLGGGWLCALPLVAWPAAAWHATTLKPVARQRGADPGCLLVAIVIVVVIVAAALGAGR